MSSEHAEAPKKGLFKRLFERIFKSGVPPAEAPHVPHVEPHATHDTTHGHKEEKKVDSSESQQVQDMLITATSKAKELLPGVFSKEALDAPQVRNLVLDILSVSDSDVYNSSDWLDGKIRQVTSIEGSLATLGAEDKGILSEMRETLKRRKQKLERDERRFAEAKKDLHSGKIADTEKHLREVLAEVPKNQNSVVDEFKNKIQAYLDASPEQRAQQYDGNEEVVSTDNRGRQVSRKGIKGSYLERVHGEMNDYIRSEYNRISKMERDQRVQELRNLRDIEDTLDQLKGASASYWNDLTGAATDAHAEVGGPEQHRYLLQHDQNYRDYYFYKLMQPVLFDDRRETHRDLINYILQGQIEDFMTQVSEGKMIVNGEEVNVGRRLVAHYKMLKNMINQSHDMDFFAAHPAQGIEDFMNSTASFTNSYIDFAYQSPMVALAKRMYEVALLQIRENHGGYIPRRYLEYSRSAGNIPVDEMVRKLMLQAIKNGQVYDNPINFATGEKEVDVFQRLRPSSGKNDAEKFTIDDLYGGAPAGSTEWRRKLGDFQVAAALKQAKGLALVDIRFLEILAKSKGTGSGMKTKNIEQNYHFGGPGFGSIPYEGIARHLEPIIHYYSRFKIGDRKMDAFFNFMITEKSDFNPEAIKEIITWQQEGNQKAIEKKYGKKIASRLISQDNPFLYSGMWGSMTGWRVGMSTMGWDDWKSERLSTANRLTAVGDRYIILSATGHVDPSHEPHGVTRRNIDGKARAKVDEYYTYEFDGMAEFVKKQKNKYRQLIKSSGDVRLMQIANDDLEFEKHWKTTGINQGDPSDESGRSFQQIIESQAEHAQGKYGITNTKKTEMALKAERAYKSRIWTQAVMRSPLIVAREWSTDYKMGPFSRSGALRKKLLAEILHIDLPEIGPEQEPTKQQQEQLDRINELEGALASLSEKARRENRDLRESDFDDIVDKQGDTSGSQSHMRDLALRYWHGVQEAILGTSGDHAAEIWYDALGIKDADVSGDLKDYIRRNNIDISDERLEGLRSHQIDFSKIEHINIHSHGDDYADIFHGHGPHGVDTKKAMLGGRMVDRDWRYLFSTEDMGWEYLNVTSLGERNPVRRSGDLASHAQFSQGLDKLLSPAGGAIHYHLNQEEYHKTMTEMWNAISGDDADVAFDVTQRIFYNTMLMYRKFSPKFGKIPILGWGAAKVMSFSQPMSVMQILAGGVAHGDAFGSQDILKQIHMGEESGYVLPSPENPLTGNVDHWTEWNAHTLESRLGADKKALVYEATNEIFWILFILILYQALKQAGADDQGGGGGGHGDHH